MAEKKIHKNITIIYDEKKHAKEVELIKKTYSSIIEDINTLWGLKQNTEIKIHISESSLKFIFYSLSVYKKILLCMVFPIWYFKTRKHLVLWRNLIIMKNSIANILIGPIEVSDNISYVIGELLFEKPKNKKKIFMMRLYSAIVNTNANSLKLSYWLNQGIVMYTIDRYIDEKFVKKETINIINDNKYKKINSNNTLNVDDQTVAYNYAKGYWTIKYLEENYPGFLKETFKKNKVNHESEIMNKIGLNTNSEEEFWIKLDDKLYDYFKDKISN